MGVNRPTLTYVDDPMESCRAADAVLHLTAWKVSRDLDPAAGQEGMLDAGQLAQEAPAAGDDQSVVRNFAGIRQQPGSVGWNKILIAPQPPPAGEGSPHAITSAEATFDSQLSTAESSASSLVA